MIYYQNTQYYLESSATDTRGNFISGLTINYTVYKSSDDSLVDSGIMTEIGTTGIYKAPIIFTEAIQYRVIYITPLRYENIIETIIVTEIGEQLKRILGLSQENYRIFNPQYDRHNNLIAGTIKTYSNANDVDTDTNPIAEYEITANFNLRTNLMTSYKVKKK